jgi:hypothetical protein
VQRPGKTVSHEQSVGKYQLLLLLLLLLLLQQHWLLQLLPEQ